MKKAFGSFTALMISIGAISLPVQASYTPTYTVSGQLALSVSGSQLTITDTISVTPTPPSSELQIFACSSSVNATLTASNLPVQGCVELFGDSSGSTRIIPSNNLSNAYKQTGQSTYTRYDTDMGAHIVAQYKLNRAQNTAEFIYSASVLATAPAPTPLATPVLGTGFNQISARLGTVGGQPGVYNTQFLVFGNPTSVMSSGPTSAGQYRVTGVSYSIDSEPHALALYSGARPSAIGGSVSVISFSQGQTSVNFTPSQGASNIVACWSVNFYETANSAVPLTVCTDNSTRPVGSSSSRNGSVQAAPKYAGPEFSSFGAPVRAGDKLVSQGKRLDGITSLTINGAAATYKVNSASELEIDVPKDLAPGKYDIEITSTHGKLTHLQAFTVKAVVPTKTLEFKGDGRTLGYDELLELTKMAKQIGAEYTSVKCIVNAADAAVAQRLVSRGCDYVGAIRLRGKEVTTEAKSTYKGDGFWFKIVANG